MSLGADVAVHGRREVAQFGDEEVPLERREAFADLSELEGCRASRARQSRSAAEATRR